jgi:cation diffusion facilitator CzcD-associated flavoprotein CzcO
MRYPGIRSDSDLYTFGFAWRPWTYDNPIAEGPLIVKYMKECTAETGIDKHIRYNHKLKKAVWQSRSQNWTLSVEVNSDTSSSSTSSSSSSPTVTTTTTKLFRGKFMVLGTGYYDYDTPLETTIPGLDTFNGTVLHPQFWPADLDYTDKNIAVIGSGATAITLIPAMAQKARKVTMIQRSPGYVISIPNRAAPLSWWMRMLPATWRLRLVRLRFLLMGFFYRRFLTGDSEKTRQFLARMTQAQLPGHIPYDPHFKPSYAPWTQRMCLCPDGDFFKSLHSKRADVVTGIIRTVESDGVRMENGDKIDADLIVTATGLRMKYGGNADYLVDGEPLDWGKKFLWRGVMVQDLPNAAIVMGYTKASWTLGADATAHMVVRIIRHLDRNGFDSATPRRPRLLLPPAPAGSHLQTLAPGVMGLTSTYIMSAIHRLPKTTDEEPWKQRGNYMKDIWDAKYSSINKGMQFVKSPYS